MILKNVSIINFNDFEVIDGVNIYIENGLIKDIVNINNDKNNLNINKKQENRKIFDCSDYYIISGATNLHSHTSMTLLKGVAEDVKISDWFNKYIWIYEKNLTPDYVYYGALLGAIEMLMNGITFVADHYFYMDKVYDAYSLAGIRADLAWAVFDFDSNFNKSLDFIKEYKNKSRLLTLSLGPHSPYVCSEKFLKEISKISEKENMKIHIHVSEEQWQVDKSLKEYNKKPIEFIDSLGLLNENTILAHAFVADDEELEIVKKRNATIAHAPKTFMRFGLINDILVRALEKNIKISLATDGPASNITLSIFEVATDAALMAKIARKDPEIAKINEIVKLINNGLKNINLNKSTDIKKGTFADLIFIEKNSINLHPDYNIFANILYGMSSESIKHVMVNGEFVIFDRKHTKIDLNSLIKEVKEIKKFMIKRSGDRPIQYFE